MHPTQYTFTAKVDLFERDKGRYYVSVLTALSKPLEHLADRGLIAVTASIGKSTWPTSLLPMGDGTHFIALPARVRTREKLFRGDDVLDRPYSSAKLRIVRHPASAIERYSSKIHHHTLSSNILTYIIFYHIGQDVTNILYQIRKST
jgi:hypothetical protein